MYVRTYTNDDVIAAAARMCLSYLFLCGRNTQSFSLFPPFLLSRKKKPLPRKTEGERGTVRKEPQIRRFLR